MCDLNVRGQIELWMWRIMTPLLRLVPLLPLHLHLSQTNLVCSSVSGNIFQIFPVTRVSLPWEHRSLWVGWSAPNLFHQLSFFRTAYLHHCLEVEVYIWITWKQNTDGVASSISVHAVVLPWILNGVHMWLSLFNCLDLFMQHGVSVH